MIVTDFFSPPNLNRNLILICYLAYRKEGETKMGRSKKFVLVGMLIAVALVESIAGIGCSPTGHEDGLPPGSRARARTKLY